MRIITKTTFNIEMKEEEVLLLSDTLKKINGLLNDTDLEDNEQEIIDEFIYQVNKK